MTGLAICLTIFLLALAFALGYFDEFARTASSRAWMRLRRAEQRVRSAIAATRRHIAGLRRHPHTRPAQAPLLPSIKPDSVDFEWNLPSRDYPRPRGARPQKRDAA